MPDWSWARTALGYQVEGRLGRVPEGGREGLGRGRKQSRGLGTLTPPLCSPVIPGSCRREAAWRKEGCVDGSSPNLPHCSARPRAHCEQVGAAAACTPAHWPSWVLGPRVLPELSLGPGHQSSAVTRPQTAALRTWGGGSWGLWAPRELGHPGPVSGLALHTGRPSSEALHGSPPHRLGHGP